jgi:vesicle-associated membrane protein 72
VYLVVSNDGMGREAPFAFLERIKESFKQQYGNGRGVKSSEFDIDFGYEDKFDVAYSLDKEFGYVSMCECMHVSTDVYSRLHV